MIIKHLKYYHIFKSIIPSPIRDNTINFYSNYLNIEKVLYLPLFESFAFSFANNYSSILACPIKETSKLFEAYCLLTIDYAITDLGFSSETKELEYEHIIKKFYRDDFEIEVIYQVDAKDVSVAKKNDIYYIIYDKEHSHISQDFSLILKRNEIPICLMIFDSKCRKIGNVVRDISSGKYENNIRDYLSLRFSYEENPFLKPKVVDTLWLLLPDDNNDIEFSPIKKLEYRICKLTLNGQEDKFVESLQNYLSPFLD